MIIISNSAMPMLFTFILSSLMMQRFSFLVLYNTSVKQLLWWSSNLPELSISATKWVVYTIYRWLILPIYFIHKKISVDTFKRDLSSQHIHVRNSEARPAATNSDVYCMSVCQYSGFRKCIHFIYYYNFNIK